MSVTSDGVTIIGDGTNPCPKLALATAAVADITALQAYDGMATVIQVADKFQGGTFVYDTSVPYILSTLTFNGGTITLPSPQDKNLFRAEDVIRISGTTSPNYDGIYKVKSFDDSIVTVVSPSFVTESTKATISVLPYQNDFVFSYASGTVTIFNSNYPAFGPASFLANNFKQGQQISVTGTSGYNGTFTIASVSHEKITALVSSSFPDNEFAYATLTNTSSYTPPLLTPLVFNEGGTAPAVISDNTTGLATSGFYAGQSIQISGTASNNGVFKILDVPAPIGDTSQLIINQIFNEPSIQTAAITTADGGTTFQAFGKKTGCWRRLYDPKGGLSVTWFGAKPATGANFDPINTVAIQTAIDVAAQKPGDVAPVYFPHGTFRVSQLVLPRGVYLKGEGARQANGGTRITQIFDATKPNTSMILFSSFTSGNALRYWDGKICDIAFQGASLVDPDPKKPPLLHAFGFGISFRTIEGCRVALDDMAILDNIIVRGFPSGGIEMPLGAAPAFISNVKFELNGGPGISIIKPLVTAAQVQSTSFINISGDGNIGGLVSMAGYNATNCFVFINLKGENSDSNPYAPNITQQQNMFVIDNSFNAMISIHGACNQSVVTSGGTRKAIGDLILRKDNSKPILFWNGVNFRFVPGQSGVEPKILSDSQISYTQNAGYTGGAFTTDNILPTANNTFSLGSSDFKYANVNTTNVQANNIQAATMQATTSVQAPTLQATTSVQAPTLQATTGIQTPTLEATTSIQTPTLKVTNVQATSVQASNLLQLGTTGANSPSVAVNLNDIKKSVALFVNSASTNTPVPGAGNLLSLAQSDSFSNQLFLKNGLNAMYIRNNLSETWMPWVKVITNNTADIATDDNYLVKQADRMVKLPVITADRTLVLPSASTNAGSTLTIWNKNTAAFNWSFATGVVVDVASAPVTTLANNTIHSLMSDGINWVKVN